MREGAFDLRERRRRIAGDVSDESYAAWRAYCERWGISVAAMLEVVGLVMGEVLAEARTIDDLTPLSQEVVRRARSLDAERRKRAGLERRPSW